MATPEFPTYRHTKKTKGGGFTKPLPPDPRQKNLYAGPDEPTVVTPGGGGGGGGSGVTVITGNLGIGTTNPTSSLSVIGDGNFTGVVTATTFIGSFIGAASSVALNSVGLGTYTYGDYVKNITGTSNQITVTGGTGEGSTPILSIPNQFTAPQDVTVARDLLVTRNLSIDGNVTIGGTSATIFSSELKIYDPDIVLGVRTDGSGNDVSTDNTANHGGIAIASTEGNPLIQLYDVGIGETNPATYKKIMWFKEGTFSGLGTDAWLANYAVGIGSTQFPTGTRLAAGSVQFTERDLSVVQNINSSGVVTATSFVKVGGTSSQFLKADGSIDTNTYLTSVPSSSEFTSGTVLLFYQAAAPTGWTQVTTQNNKALRVVSGTGGGTGGTTDFTTVFTSRTVPLPDHDHGTTNTGTVNAPHGHNTSVGGGNNNTGTVNAPHSHTINISGNTPNSENHFHNYSLRNVGPANLSAGGSIQRAGVNVDPATTQPAGSHSHPFSGSGSATNDAPHSHPVSVNVNTGDAPHSHPFSVGNATIRSGSNSSVAHPSPTIDFAVQYIDVIICSKN